MPFDNSLVYRPPAIAPARSITPNCYPKSENIYEIPTLPEVLTNEVRKADMLSISGFEFKVNVYYVRRWFNDECHRTGDAP